jgi:hypothetical protein
MQGVFIRVTMLTVSISLATIIDVFIFRPQHPYAVHILIGVLVGWSACEVIRNWGLLGTRKER